MCGIAGILIGGQGASRLDPRQALACVERMAERLTHRGPDHRHSWLDPRGCVAFAHRRLAIIDLHPTGNQPMLSRSGETALTYNGEVYNYLELRSELEGQGVAFRGTSDTEVVLELYEKRGPDFLAHLRGMFALGLWDGRRRSLLLARDRLGKKPLYYVEHGGRLYFGSEIKALAAALPDQTLTLDEEALSEYLSLGCLGGARTIYREIKELPPGHRLIVDAQGRSDLTPYWSPRWLPKRTTGFADAVEQVDRLLEEAVALRLRADVPVGVFLSGGIDSGLVTAYAAKHRARITTLSVGFAEDSFDERPLAKSVAERYGTDHREILVEPSLERDLPRIFACYDEPLADPSLIPTYYVAEAAAAHLKVVLNGDGGDELFGGYRRHLAAALQARIERALPRGLLASLARGGLGLLPEPRRSRSRYALGHRLLLGWALDRMDQIIERSGQGFTGEAKSALLGRPLGEDPGRRRVAVLLERVAGLDPVDQALALDLIGQLPDDLLVKMDMATMAHSLEARAPFLDHVLAEHVLRLPSDLKVRGTLSKPLVRELAKRHLPRPVADAPKRGFEIPLHDWLSSPLSALCHDALLSRDSLTCQLFERPGVEGLLENRVRLPASTWARRVWILFALEMWNRTARVEHSAPPGPAEAAEARTRPAPAS